MHALNLDQTILLAAWAVLDEVWPGWDQRPDRDEIQAEMVEHVRAKMPRHLFTLQ